MRNIHTLRISLFMFLGIMIIWMNAGRAVAAPPPEPGQAPWQWRAAAHPPAPRPTAVQVVAQASVKSPPAAPAADLGGLTLTYAQVITFPAPIYPQPLDGTAEISPVRVLGPGYQFVSLDGAQPIQANGQPWREINRGEYMPATSLAIRRPSKFQGLILAAPPERPLGWLVYATQVSAEPGAQPAKTALRLARYTPVTIHEEKKVGDWAWYRVGDSQWVEQRRIAIVQPRARPEGVGPTDKWVDVSLFEQTLAAYEGDRMVYATLISSGLKDWETDEGIFRIWAKVKINKMSGRDGFPDYYYLEDVPWIMYFNRDMALHGAYWHDGFGFRHSHGCVNLAPADAKWLYDWTTPGGDTRYVLPNEENPGSWVWVHQ